MNIFEDCSPFSKSAYDFALNLQSQAIPFVWLRHKGWVCIMVAELIHRQPGSLVIFSFKKLRFHTSCVCPFWLSHARRCSHQLPLLS